MEPADKKIRLLLVDDHPIVREGIRSCLSRYEDLVVVGEAANGFEAVALSKTLSPDVVLMDINMPGLGGLETTGRLQQEVPETKVLVLTAHESKEYILQIVQSGARGYVLKDAPPDELLRAIRTIQTGNSFFSPRVATYLLNDYVDKSNKPKAPSFPPLSRREREVLALLADGLSNKEIARALRVGVRTVETHRERIMRKLEIHSVAGLTKYAIANRITRIPED